MGFGQSADIDIVFDGGDTRKLAEVKTEDGKKEKYLLYYDGETVSGKVNNIFNVTWKQFTSYINIIENILLFVVLMFWFKFMFNR